MALMASTRREVDVPNYPIWLLVVTPFLALVLQSLITAHIPRFDYLDLPLLVAIYFGITWRHPIGGAVFGAGIGILQDAITQHPLGVFGIGLSLVGYLAASIGIRIDTESFLTRLILLPAFTLLQGLIVWGLERRVIEQAYAWIWWQEGIRAAVSAVLGLMLFALLDKARRRD
jgi:rod shape-determining protein MreD